jgi:hypothetical protein
LRHLIERLHELEEDFGWRLQREAVLGLRNIDDTERNVEFPYKLEALPPSLAARDDPSSKIVSSWCAMCSSPNWSPVGSNLVLTVADTGSNWLSIASKLSGISSWSRFSSTELLCKSRASIDSLSPFREVWAKY